MTRIILSLTGLFFLMTLNPPKGQSETSQNYTVKYYSYYLFREDRNEILDKIEVSEKEIHYLKQFWIVYYDRKARVLGEELHSNWRMSQYFIYRYDGKRTHKRGFYWHGFTDEAFFYNNVGRRVVWQGYYFKRNPDFWWVYDEKNRLVSKTHYSVTRPYLADYTDVYHYDEKELKRITRYRDNLVTKIYHFKRGVRQKYGGKP